ncbi:hypothetical protein B0H12DRAFT_1241502 [Mycena haematopus]|nr:hypothetical protein B0H12DRAFT_1241502 [Mycena haematopus]
MQTPSTGWIVDPESVASSSMEMESESRPERVDASLAHLVRSANSSNDSMRVTFASCIRTPLPFFQTPGLGLPAVPLTLPAATETASDPRVSRFLRTVNLAMLLVDSGQSAVHDFAFLLHPRLDDLPIVYAPASPSEKRSSPYLHTHLGCISRRERRGHALVIRAALHDTEKEKTRHERTVILPLASLYHGGPSLRAVVHTSHVPVLRSPSHSHSVPISRSPAPLFKVGVHQSRRTPYVVHRLHVPHTARWKDEYA